MPLGQPFRVVVGEPRHARGVGPHQRAQRQINADRLNRLHQRGAAARGAKQDQLGRQQGQIDGGGGLGVIDAREHRGAMRRHGGDQTLDRLGLIAPALQGDESIDGHGVQLSPRLQGRLDPNPADYRPPEAWRSEGAAVVFGWRRPADCARFGSMTPGTATMLDRPSLPPESADYPTVRRAIEFLSTRWRDQPAVDEVAAEVGLSPSHFQHVFKRWAGLTPKAFLQAITIERARELLRDSASVLDAAYDVGLSGPSRLHDLFVSHEALTPGDYRRDDLVLRYGFHPSPFGEALVVAAPRGMAGLGFVDDGDRASALADMRRRWPRAQFVADDEGTASAAARAFDPSQWRPDTPLRIVMIGTDFEVRVWETLLSVPMGCATTYSDIAVRLGKPKAARAVGAAVGRNPISFVVPCHRVLGRSGALTGYHWGLARKQAIIGWEAGKVAAS